MNEKKVKAKYRGVLKIGNIEIPCFVLEDGTRVISGRGMTNAIGMRGRGQGMTRIIAHKTLSPYIIDKLRVAIENPLFFLGSSSRKSNPTAGYEATILNDLCEAVLQARDAGVLKTEQERRYAQYCDSLIRAFAKVGIIALIDEATGYQDDRDRDELTKLLAIYLSEERLTWAKMFPDEFYKQIYRLRGWSYPTASKSRRTPLLGKITNEIVYEKLPEGVLVELRKRNPVLQATKRRRWKFTQFLSYDLGQPDLRNHLLQVVALMRASANWSKFKRLFVRVFPSGPEQAEMEFIEDED